MSSIARTGLQSENPGDIKREDSKWGFGPDQPNLKQKAVRGAAITGVAQAGIFFLRFAATILLARLLVPEDFGLVAMASAVIAILTYAGDLGLSEATIQRPNITHAQLSSLFWVNVAAGGTLALISVALAPLLVRLYGDHRLLWVAMVLGSEFLFKGLSYQHQAILNRMMQFRAIAITKIIALSVGVALAIIAALLGARYWSLVILQLMPPLGFLFGMWVACDWRPGAFSRHCGLRSLLTFGGNLTGFNFLSSFAQSMDKILLGQRWSPHAVGLYSKVYQLVLLPMQQALWPLARVVVPTLSRLQEDADRYRRYYDKVISLLAYATMPLLIVLGVLAEEVVVLVLGPQWYDSAPILRVLCVAAFGRPIVTACNWVCISTGQTKKMVRWALISTPLLCIGFLVGLPWGAMGVAVAYAVCIHILNVPNILVFLSGSPISVRDVLNSSWRPALISMAVCPALYFVKQSLAGTTALTVATLTSISAIALFGLIFGVWPAVRREVFELLAHVKALRASKEKQPNVLVTKPLP